MDTTRDKLMTVYRRLFDSLGPQGWWPAKDQFEVALGAILTQATSWRNVEQAISHLKGARVLNPAGVTNTPARRLSVLIKPSLYQNTKARKLKSFTQFFLNEFEGSFKLMSKQPTDTLRERLLGVWGIGPETADSILLYACDKPSFVVDAYTKRVFSRLGFLKEDESYENVKHFFEENLPRDVQLYKEYHALIVAHAKSCCKKKPECSACALNHGCSRLKQEEQTKQD